MKKQKKRFLPVVFAMVLAVGAGLLAFTELLAMYANNMDDFWFDFSVMARPTLLLTLIPVVGVFLGMTILYAILKKFKKEHIYYILFALASAGFVACYVHANFLAGMLPPLDGTEFDWGGVGRNLVSILVVLVTFGGMIFLVKKYRPEKAAGVLNYVNLAVITMLLVSLVTTVATTDVFKAKEVNTVASTKNINLVSTKKNYFVFMVDAVDAKMFKDVLEEEGGTEEELKDFSFFIDSLSGYPFTRDSIPFIFSGTWNENEKPFADYSTEAFDNTAFFDTLTKNNYAIKNFYDNDFVWRSRKAFEFDNIESVDKTIRTRHFMTQELKYVLFKTLPFPLKRFSKIDQMKFDDSRAATSYVPFKWDDVDFYHETLKGSVEKTDKQVFSYIHLEGAHVPYNLNKNVELIDSGTYRMKVEATLTLIKGFIDYLKKAEAYDDAVIVVLADHGYNTTPEGGPTRRQNPLLMVKGIGETHSRMYISGKQVSYADLAEMFEDLLDGKDSTELFSDVPEEGRERRYLYYVFTKEDHMIEQTLNGKAWETEKMEPTGKEFNL